MTTLDIDAIEKRLEAATPGQWRKLLADGLLKIWSRAAQCEIAIFSWGGHVFKNGPANADFIVHARDDIFDLLVEVKRLRALTDWQSMDTAPLNLTPILVDTPEGEIVAQYECYAKEPYWSFDIFDRVEGRAEFEVHPTRWRPI